MRVLGIDPGLNIAGYACLEMPPLSPAPGRIVEAGTFRFRGRDPVPARLAELEADLNTLIERTQPAIMCVEAVYSHYAFPRTAIIMAHARGVILCAAQRNGLDISEVPSTQAKKSITGNGHASKSQIQSAVQLLLGLPTPPEPADVADAIAIALAGHRRLAARRAAARA